MKKKHDDLDLAALVTPDPERLDYEWTRQPKLYLKYSLKLADARLALAEAKAQLEVTEAEVARDIRDDPASYGMDKVTEKSVEAAIVIQPPCLAAAKILREAQHRVDVLGSVVGALDHRKKALENHVTLFCYQYTSVPKAPEGAGREHTREAEKRATRKPIRRRDES